MDPIAFLTDPMAYGFMQRGLVAALLVGVLCAVMGTFVVLKGLAFIGDAVSHATFPGLVIAYLVGAPLYIGGAIAAVAVSLAIGYVSRRGRLRFDPAVGVLFVLSPLFYALAVARHRESFTAAIPVLLFVVIVASLWPYRKPT